MPVVGTLGERFTDVRRIAVLRGGGLGDVVFALPAVEALAAAYPEAEITLLGTPLHRALFADRPGPVRHVEVLPVAPGIRDAAGAEHDPAAVDAFFAGLAPRGFDLAVQVHGGGRNSNPFVLRLGARHTVGLATPDAPPLERTVPYVYYQHEVLRDLEVAALAGAPAVTLDPRVAVTDDERAVGLSHRPPGADRLVVVHPGATDPRRRWPAERYGEVAAALAEDGVGVLLVGDATDLPAAEQILAVVDERVTGPARALVGSLVDQLSLSALTGVLATADVVLGNDSGPRHLGQAVGAATVGIFWFGNVVNAAPFGRGRHRVLMSFTRACPVCGADVTQVGWTAVRCPHDPSFVAEVGTDAVLADVRELLGTAPRRSEVTLPGGASSAPSPTPSSTGRSGDAPATR
nr:glycosyltransferase family 9 protein [Cellulomonas marina]